MLILYNIQERLKRSIYINIVQVLIENICEYKILYGINEEGLGENRDSVRIGEQERGK